jgi:hypothetical protein
MVLSDVSQNVTQTLSTLISLAITLILTPSLSQTHFCKSDNCGISKVTRDSDLICQILTLTLYSLMKILFTLIKFRNLYRVFKSLLSEISTAATVPISNPKTDKKYFKNE